jgi:hypothetical protein
MKLQTASVEMTIFGGFALELSGCGLEFGGLDGCGDDGV